MSNLPPALAALGPGLSRPAPAHEAERGFAALARRAGAAPLTEIAPAASGDDLAAFGFALAWARAAAEGLILLAMPEALEHEIGAPFSAGVSQFGLPLDRLILAPTRSQADALWACEQALSVRGAYALCVVAPARKGLSLTATRRLLLRAEENGARCLLLRYDGAEASAAWTRWRIAHGPSQAPARELGRPAFSVSLVRSRFGPSGLSWRVEWNAHESGFLADAPGALDGAAPAAPVHRALGASYAA